jgi:integrase/recombinase XerC
MSLFLPLLNKFLKYLETLNYSIETIYNYKRDLETFQNFLREENIKFREIKKEVISKYKNYLLSKTRKTATNRLTSQSLSIYSINRMLSALRSYFRYLNSTSVESPISYEAITTMKHVKRAKKQIHLKNQLRLVEAPTLIEKNKIVALRNRAMLELIFSTGIRISELVNLKTSQLSENKIILENKSVKRIIHLSKRARKYINLYLETRKNIVSPYLFIPYRGKNVGNVNKKISPNYLQDKIKQYRNLLGIKELISANSLRYPFEIYLEEQASKPFSITKILKHEVKIVPKYNFA